MCDMDYVPEYLCGIDTTVLNFLYDLDNVPDYLSDIDADLDIVPNNLFYI